MSPATYDKPISTAPPDPGVVHPAPQLPSVLPDAAGLQVRLEDPRTLWSCRALTAARRQRDRTSLRPARLDTRAT